MSCKTNNIVDCTEVFIQLSILPNKMLTVYFLLTGLYQLLVLTSLASLDSPAFIDPGGLPHLAFRPPLLVGKTPGEVRRGTQTAERWSVWG